MQKGYLLQNENGSVMVIALILLVLLTLIGVSATNTSNIEVKIAVNDYQFKRNLYTSEGAVMRGAQEIENATDSQLQDRSFTSFVWLKGAGTFDMTKPGNWSVVSNAAYAATIDPNNTTMYAAVEKGIAAGSSVSMTGQTMVYEYGVYGLCNANSGQSLVEIGFRKRF